MNTIKPASETLDCAGIRRMEFGQPQPLPLGEERAVGARGHLAEVLPDVLQIQCLKERR